MPYEPIIGDGEHLGSSRDLDGAVVGLAFDEANKLVGQARWVWVDEPDSDPEDSESRQGPPPVVIAAVGIAVGVVGTVAAIKAAPHIKAWWNDTALPSMKARWNRVTNRRDNDSDATEGTALSAPAAVSFSQEVDAALEDDRIIMSSAEAEQRVIALLLAAAFIAEQLRTLSSAQIVDSEGIPQLQGALAKLTTQQVTDGINRALESGTSFLDERTSAELLRTFGGGGVIDGQYKPLLNDQVQEALSLTAVTS